MLILINPSFGTKLMVSSTLIHPRITLACRGEYTLNFSHKGNPGERSENVMGTLGFGGRLSRPQEPQELHALSLSRETLASASSLPHRHRLTLLRLSSSSQQPWVRTPEVLVLLLWKNSILFVFRKWYPFLLLLNIGTRVCSLVHLCIKEM